ARVLRLRQDANEFAMFLGALQVTWITALRGFFAEKSWQLLTDDLPLTHAQNARLEQVVDPNASRPRAEAALRVLRGHAQRLEEAQLADALAAALAGQGDVAEPAQRLKKYYHAEVRRLQDRSGVVTRLSTGLFA